MGMNRKIKKKIIAMPTELWILRGNYWEKSECITPYGIVMKDGIIYDWKEIDIR